ncbi:S-layer homology domain-containing protein [Saccharibacillus endophyticus]|uniref:SLH domain-containing protein n=1 Tax=Saccharibacillus endophyticus TaxID=2060666 RepID=A0ABQ2A919_9BACL|nr:S-layer homology domain-containing protein [Saccharibacillus endophyticus]GGH88067.1 hypothetical protein GCM10007362_51680 [Saccharibacillus endophyticus]
MFKKLLSITAVSVVAATCMTTTTASAALPTYGEEWQAADTTPQTVTFADLPSIHWANTYIAEMVNRKVISGYPDGKFRPNNTITRAEFAKIMITASGVTPKKVNYSSFSDIPATNWASPFIEAVKDYMTGYRTADSSYIFNPSAPATREDVAVALVKLKGYDTNRLPDQSTIKAMFRDYDGISESAKNYVALAVENGLVSGFQDETFRPQATITRAEATVMLWRAYQYGNDNKQIGDGQSTTTTAPSTPVSTPSNPAPSTDSSTTTPSAKFTVETLVGGSAAGDVDGPVRTAKINKIDSMVVDKDNNIYFLDARNKKIRKFNSSNGTVETFKTIDQSFNWDYKDADGNAKHYDYSSLTPHKLAYNAASNKVYLTATGKANTSPGIFVYDITGNVSVAAYDLNSANPHYINFVAFPTADTVLYGSNDWDESYMYEGKLNGSQMDLVASSQDNGIIDISDSSYGYAPVAAAYATENNVYVFGRSKLYNLQLFPVKAEKVIEYDRMGFSSVGTYNSKLYMTQVNTVYEMGTDGQMTTFVKGEDLVYNDGTTIKEMQQLSFDTNGNILFYDPNSYSIRRINL